MGDWPFFFGLALLIGGVISVGGAVLNLDIFMESPKAEPFVERFGRTGARVFYIILGIFIAIVGAAIVSQ
ncbi:MAG: immunity 17 family protein [Pirellulales bacterium]|nr:immunity 17 family protein [Pirellulales bacterium]